MLSAIFITVLTLVIVMNEVIYFVIIQNKHWVLSGGLVVLFLFSKKHFTKIASWQLAGLCIILGLSLISWMTIPYLTRMGLFFFSTLCFLYSGIVIFNSKFITAQILFISTYVISAINFLPVIFYVAEESLISKTLINSLFISNASEINEYLSGKLSIAMVLIAFLFLFSTCLLVFRRANLVVKKVHLSILALFVYSFGISLATGPTKVLITEYAHYQSQRTAFKHMLAERRKGGGASFEILSNDGAKRIMVIIGESLNRKYMSLYGYDEDTSPNLKRMATESAYGMLIPFSDVISPEVTTVPSLEKALTNKNNVNGIQFEESTSILDVFKKADYETFWISNHPPLGEYDTPTSVIASTADHTYFSVNNDGRINAKRSTQQYLDGDLLGVFRTKIENSPSNEKQIYFIHLMGSHFNYSDRYPQTFKFFHVQDKNQNENNYLNSVLYNDWVVSNFLKIGQENQVDIIFYFSDHGENIKYQHNENHYQKDMSEIPFIVYLSNDYIEKNEIIASKVLKCRNVPAMTDNLFHDIQGITGVISSLYNPTESFVSPHYISNKRRVVDNTVCYD